MLLSPEPPFACSDDQPVNPAPTQTDHPPPEAPGRRKTAKPETTVVPGWLSGADSVTGGGTGPTRFYR
jgi:hypothetical protein